MAPSSTGGTEEQRRFQNEQNNSNNAKALNMLTEKIARRLRSELENDPGVIQTRHKNDANAQNAKHVAAKQAQESSQYQCGICFELLLGDRQPKIIVPCGHTFCAICIDHHLKVNPGRKSVCPYCRAKIESTAVNHHLRQLVEAYAAKQTVGLKPDSSSNNSNNNHHHHEQDMGAGGGGMAGARYLREYNMLKTRRRILIQEQTETVEEMKQLDVLHHRNRKEEQRIRNEEKQAALDVEAAKKRLARIRVRLEEQQCLTLTVKEQKEMSETKLNMIQSTLTTINKDADKAHVMASAAAQNGGGR